MPPGSDPNLPDDLRSIEERLRRERLDVSALELDRLKRRALAQFAAGRTKSSARRSRLAAVVTAVVMLVGAGGAVALSGLDSHPNTHGGAADTQYKPPHSCSGRHRKMGRCACPKGKTARGGNCVCPKGKKAHDRRCVSKPRKPSVHTGPAHHESTHSEEVTGSVNGHHTRTSYHFVYGECRSVNQHGGMNHSTRSFHTTSSSAKPVSAKLDHLKPGTRYCYQLVASNKAGTARGQVRSFTTPSNTHHTTRHGARQPSRPEHRRRGFTG